ncbi:MAG: lysylphosphatidylglycerol synthase transmembrane domain-containing protein [Sandaracinaceae bacterium]
MDAEHEPETEPTRGRSTAWWIRWGLGLVATALLLWALSSQIDAERAWSLTSEADPAWVAIGFGLYLMLVFVRSVRYRVIAPDVPLATLTSVHGVHALLLRVMPFRSGELGFAWLMRRAGAAGFSQSLVGLLMIRILDFAALLVVFAVGLVTYGQTSFAGGRVALLPWILLGLVALAAPLYLRFCLRIAVRIMDGLLTASRLHRVARIAGLATKIRDAVAWAQTVSTATLFRATAWTTLQFGVNFALIYSALAAMHIDATLGQTILGGTGAAIGGLLPLAGVGNFGTLETGWALGFVAVGIETPDAVASAFTYSVLTVSYAAVTAFVGWLTLPRKKSVTDKRTRS